jgi:NAD(P)-dependent dehydrogenase (short-subunit alcohol dehydrogenase family)
MTIAKTLTGRRVLVPGGTGSVGEGVVRAYLAAGADVVVPTRTPARAEQYHRVLADAATDKLHLVVHDYTTFAGAEQLAGEMTSRLGGIDDVIAPIGGWWAGKALWEIDESDWQDTFVGITTTHLAVARAALPLLSHGGTYQVIVGDSANVPIPGSGLISMEQSAVLMMRRVLAAEVTGGQRVFALMLGPVRTRTTAGDDDWVTADQIGATAIALSSADQLAGQEFHLGNAAETTAVIATVAVAGKAEPA